MAVNVLKKNEKENAKLISDTKFYVIVGATLFFGFLVNVIEVSFFSSFFASLHVGYFFLGFFICTIAGMIINIVSKIPVLSFIGYCMVIFPLGAMFSLVLPGVSIYIVRSAFISTCLIAGVVMLLAVVYPNIFNSIFKVVSTCFMVAFFYQCFASGTHFGLGTVADWIVVLMFACYIGLDIGIAKNKPKTLDNAIDAACGLYLDIVNVFIRLIIIIGYIAKNK
jgi:FtsH-binding integral membrane protein